MRTYIDDKIEAFGRSMSSGKEYPFDNVGREGYLARIEAMRLQNKRWGIPSDFYAKTRRALLWSSRLKTPECPTVGLEGAHSVVRAICGLKATKHDMPSWAAVIEFMSAWEITAEYFNGRDSEKLNEFVKKEQSRHLIRYVTQLQDTVRKFGVAIDARNYRMMLDCMDELDVNLDISPFAFRGHARMMVSPNLGVYRTYLTSIKRVVMQDLQNKIISIRDVITNPNTNPDNVEAEDFVSLVKALGHRDVIERKIAEEFVHLNSVLGSANRERSSGQAFKPVRIREFLPEFKYSGEFATDYAAYWSMLDSRSRPIVAGLVARVADQYFSRSDDDQPDNVIDFNLIKSERRQVSNGEEVNLATLLENKFDRMIAQLIARRIMLGVSTPSIQRGHLALRFGFLAREDGNFASGAKNFGTYRDRCGLTQADLQNPSAHNSSVNYVEGEADWLGRRRPIS